MKNTFKIVLLTSAGFCAVSSFFACNPNSSQQVEGFAPIYKTLNEVYIVSTESARATVNAGKIFQYGNALTLQVDVNQGVHVIDCSDNTKPKKLKFISIPGVSEVTVKSNTLIANNFNDLVSIDISDLNNIQLVNRVKDVYVANQGSMPSEANTYFECPDNKKGVVVGWEKKMLVNPKCKTL